ncbi:MAG: DMT family transporter [Tabrizicola sp.]|uniref:DMT family transporter n=1 Tax=Tabrizicola sp. TaxID=2005166 RepID=UPI0027366E68|nr:DMT family transporter [Tabrizicola sp.]MDP3262092.1 DMT family transporter [Tabrizicola sp.]MDP3648162.1 DMT family transporter [Paracoccaceae bacterium]MDZ4068587.1 DMT family transporter [Tabrizicola sp.]
MNSTLRGALFSLAAFGFYATHDVVVKLLGETYSSFQIIFFSGLMGFPLVTLMLMGDRRDGTLIPRHPWWTALRTVAAMVTGVMGFFAFSKLPLAQCYAIFFAMPLLITLMAIPMLGEKVGLRRGVAVIVGLIGVIIVLRPGSGDALGIGHLAALGAAITGALTSVIVRKIGSEERSVVLMLYPMVLSFFVMGLVMPFVYVPMPIDHLALTAVMAFLGMLGALGIIAAYRIAPAVIVAPMQYSQIIWAALYGWLFFDESVDFYTWVGTAVIVASGIYIVLREQAPSVSQNRPVTESRTRFDYGTMPRISSWLKRFDRSADER